MHLVLCLRSKFFFDSSRFMSLFKFRYKLPLQKACSIIQATRIHIYVPSVQLQITLCFYKNISLPEEVTDKTERPQRCWSLCSAWGCRLQQPQARVNRPGMRRWTINCRFLYFCRRMVCAVQSVFQVNRRSCTWTASSVGSQKAVDILPYRTTSIQSV
jgi:hypothetical protein